MNMGYTARRGAAEALLVAVVTTAIAQWWHIDTQAVQALPVFAPVIGATDHPHRAAIERLPAELGATTS